MVRAAVSGALDYSQADPTDINWRLRQRLVLQEIQRREEIVFLEARHRQWLAYVSHGGLTEQSFQDVKTAANDSFDRLQDAIFPWLETPKTEPENDTILDEDTQKLVENYKAWQEQVQAQAQAKTAESEQE